MPPMLGSNSGGPRAHRIAHDPTVFGELPSKQGESKGYLLNSSGKAWILTACDLLEELRLHRLGSVWLATRPVLARRHILLYSSGTPLDGMPSKPNRPYGRCS